MDNQPFEEQYETILRNIESGIVYLYDENPEMTDWEVLAAIEGLIRRYRAETKGRQSPRPPLDPLTAEVYDLVEMICGWHRGTRPLLGEGDKPLDFSIETLTLDEIIACLKRVRKSINLWTQEGGRRGYLTFISQFLRNHTDKGPLLSFDAVPAAC